MGREEIEEVDIHYTCKYINCTEQSKLELRRSVGSEGSWGIP